MAVHRTPRGNSLVVPKAAIFKLFLALISVSIVLLAIEAVLAVVDDGKGMLHFAEPTRYQYDEALIYSHRPGVAGINSLGLRDDEIRPKGERFRIIALGDSYTFGHGVSVRDCYPAILERLLDSSAGSTLRFDVVNAGVPGYNFDQAYALFDERLAQLEPDLAIVMFEPKDLGASNVLYDLEEGEIVSRPAWKNWIYLQLWLRTRAPAWWRETHTGRFVLGRLSGSDPFRLLPTGDLDARIAWQIEKIAALLDRLTRRAQAEGFDVMIVNYPDRETLLRGGDYRHVRYFGLPTKILGENANEHMARLRDEFTRSSADFVDAMEIFRERGMNPLQIRRLYLGDDPHMNASGNRLLARVLRDAILARSTRGLAAEPEHR